MLSKATVIVNKLKNQTSNKWILGYKTLQTLFIHSKSREMTENNICDEDMKWRESFLFNPEFITELSWEALVLLSAVLLIIDMKE